MTLSSHATTESLHSKTYLEERWLHSPLPAGFSNEAGEFIPPVRDGSQTYDSPPEGR